MNLKPEQFSGKAVWPRQSRLRWTCQSVGLLPIRSLCFFLLVFISNIYSDEQDNPFKTGILPEAKSLEWKQRYGTDASILLMALPSIVKDHLDRITRTEQSMDLATAMSAEADYKRLESLFYGIDRNHHLPELLELPEIKAVRQEYGITRFREQVLASWKTSMKASIESGSLVKGTSNPDTVVKRRIADDAARILKCPSFSDQTVQVETVATNLIAFWSEKASRDDKAALQRQKVTKSLDSVVGTASRQPSASDSTVPYKVFAPSEREDEDSQKTTKMLQQQSSKTQAVLRNSVILVFLVAVVITVVTISGREKTGVTIYRDYTDVTAVVCTPIIGLIVYGTASSFGGPEWLAVGLGWGVVGVLEWRIWCQTRLSNPDWANALKAFVSKHIVILLWLFALAVYLSASPSRLKGETEAEFQRRRDRESWRSFFLMSLLTVATATLVHRLTAKRVFSNFWNYLRCVVEPVGGSREWKDDGADKHSESNDEDENSHSKEQTAPKPPSPWEILGVKPGASPEEIKRAYHSCMQEYHPDLVAHLGPELRALAEQKAKDINHAYEVLTSG